MSTTAPSEPMDPRDELAAMLRPAGGGLYVVSTGREEQLALQRRLYGVDDEAAVEARWRGDLARLDEADVVVLGIPSDVGAGFVRGASFGPQALRTALLDHPDYRALTERLRIVDLGDVFVVPQLLHDEMLSAEQLAATRRALHPTLPDAQRDALPVSPLSIAERALSLVLARNPKAKLLVLGGDHSNAWPVTAALHRTYGRDFAIVQFDAHTDLLEHRLGVKYCFATWSWHANELLGRGGRLVQLGTRASRRDEAHWESTLDVRQWWAAECLAKGDAAIDEVVAHLHAIGARRIYLSNDIDGTDARWADATGTPEPAGLEPGFVRAVIQRLGREFELIAGDVMEVAPKVACAPGGAERTLSLAADFLCDTLAAMAGRAG
jgi:agmatinase